MIIEEGIDRNPPVRRHEGSGGYPFPYDAFPLWEPHGITRERSYSLPPIVSEGA